VSGRRQGRRNDGTIDSFSSGTLVFRDGTSQPVRHDEFTLQPGRRWKSPDSRAEYPIAWTLSVPGRQIELKVRASIPQQEMNTAASVGFAYWEGSIRVRGTWAGRSGAADTWK